MLRFFEKRCLLDSLALFGDMDGIGSGVPAGGVMLGFVLSSFWLDLEVVGIEVERRCKWLIRRDFS